MLKLGIVGSRKYANESRIFKIIKFYCEKIGKNNITVVSGGCPHGADFIAKKIAISLNLHYVEFPPVHFSHNKYCLSPCENYNKPYHVGNYFERNTRIAEYSDHLFAFVLKGVPSNGTMDTFRKAKKLNKLVHLFEDENVG